MLASTHFRPFAAVFTIFNVVSDNVSDRRLSRWIQRISSFSNSLLADNVNSTTAAIGPYEGSGRYLTAITRPICRRSLNNEEVLISSFCGRRTILFVRRLPRLGGCRQQIAVNNTI